jgi:ketosteroid isomerase-like protein
VSSTTEELLQLDRERCEAISRGEVDDVAGIFRDDYTHTHIDGRREDRATYLAGLHGRPRRTQRGNDVVVRLLGDVALMTGTVRNSFPPLEPGGEPVELEVQSLQVWVKDPDGWKQVASASSGQVPSWLVAATPPTTQSKQP